MVESQRLGFMVEITVYGTWRFGGLSKQVICRLISTRTGIVMILMSL